MFSNGTYLIWVHVFSASNIKVMVVASIDHFLFYKINFRNCKVMIITLLSLTGFLKIIEEIILFKVTTLLFMVLLQYLDTKQILPLGSQWRGNQQK